MSTPPARARTQTHTLVSLHCAIHPCNLSVLCWQVSVADFLKDGNTIPLRHKGKDAGTLRVANVTLLRSGLQQPFQPFGFNAKV
jgi:hypothetical protein